MIPYQDPPCQPVFLFTIVSGQIIATSHECFFNPKKGSFLERKWDPLVQGNLGWWNITIWADSIAIGLCICRGTESFHAFPSPFFFFRPWFDNNLVIYADSGPVWSSHTANTCCGWFTWWFYRKGMLLQVPSWLVSRDSTFEVQDFEQDNCLES